MTEKKVFSPHLLHSITHEVKIIFDVFGDKVRLVGGCVRDLLTGVIPQDFDFAVCCQPNETIKILEKNNIKAVPTGLKYGTITAVINGKNFEITSLRGEENNDGRHFTPKFLSDFSEDAKRRDFTINALYLDSEGFVYDFFDGLSDLAKSRVRFIGDANARIEEDYLRILRFFRFSARYAKSLDKKGLEACLKHKSNLAKLSKPRIRSEFVKIINLQNQVGVLRVANFMQKHGFFSEIFSPKPQINAFQRAFNLKKQIEKKSGLNLDNSALLAALFFDKKFSKVTNYLSQTSTEKTANQNSFNVFFDEISATVIEKKLINFLQKNQKLIDKVCSKKFTEISSFTHDQSNDSVISKRILLEFSDQISHNQHQDFIWNFYLFLASQNDRIFRHFNSEENLEFWKTFVNSQFPISGQDLQDKGLKGKEIGVVSKKLWKVFIDKNFSIKKSDLLHFV